MSKLPQAFQLPPVIGRPPTPDDVAWVAMLPTTAPALTSAEVMRLKTIRTAATDGRVRERTQAVLTANGTP
jgi:hypothetical protein